MVTMKEGGVRKRVKRQKMLDDMRRRGLLEDEEEKEDEEGGGDKKGGKGQKDKKEEKDKGKDEDEKDGGKGAKKDKEKPKSRREGDIEVAKDKYFLQTGKVLSAFLSHCLDSLTHSLIDALDFLSIHFLISHSTRPLPPERASVASAAAVRGGDGGADQERHHPRAFRWAHRLLVLQDRARVELSHGLRGQNCGPPLVRELHHGLHPPR